ncbi:MAG: L-serine ammonia-lyase, iron-sulfur-dependent, subunit alpha [Eubacteriales bacterium]|nr:L-serine ammonia-lyase, iron-sulfur-dependent, subunit alpha [Eubacteriales bacterium]
MEKELLEILKSECVVATGCTEPIAVAYATAIAKEQIEGEKLLRLHVVIDSALYKNASFVGIPGIKDRGLPIAAALGVVIGSSKKGLRLLEHIDDEQLVNAKQLVKDGIVEISVVKECARLYIEVNLFTEQNHIRVLVKDRHQNVVSIEKGKSLPPIQLVYESHNTKESLIQKYNLADLLEFARNVDVANLEFLNAGIRMGIEMADIGLTMQKGLGKAIEEMIYEGTERNNMVTTAQILCGAAAEARMAGVPNPVMTTAGSGNHGLTVFMTNVGVAKKLNCSEDTLLRAIALSNLVTVYVKSYTGTLSAMCGCGVAAGVGAGAGVSYMLGGNETEIYHTIVNMVGSIAGLLCDGGKEGCAYKVALSSGWAVQSALLAQKGCHINTKDGILSGDLRGLFENLGSCSDSMFLTNQSIVEIIRKNSMC